MKRLRRFVLPGALLTLGAPAWANMPHPHYYPVSRCVKIENVNEFPDIVVIEYVGLAPGSIHRIHVVDQDACVHKGTKFNDYYFLWAPRSYVDSAGLSNLPIDSFVNGLSQKGATPSAGASQLHLLSKDLSPANPVEYNSGSLGFKERESEDLVYKLSKGRSGMTIRLAKKTSRFANGEVRTEIYGGAPPVASAR